MHSIQGSKVKVKLSHDLEKQFGSFTHKFFEETSLIYLVSDNIWNLEECIIS